MRTVALTDPEGVRHVPDRVSGAGVLVLAGSSGRIDDERAALLARHGALAESVRWFGGPGQHARPYEIPLELFLDRVASLAGHCDRVLVVGSSFGAEAALLVGALSPHVHAVVAVAPSDVVWAGVRPDGTLTSHWTLGGEPLAFVPFDDRWQPRTDPPTYHGLYRLSRERYPHHTERAAIAVERIEHVVLVAGGDDQVWPSLTMARSIERRRAAHGLATALLTDPAAGHRVRFPGERRVTTGTTMRRGGTDAADRRLGETAWETLVALVRPAASP